MAPVARVTPDLPDWDNPEAPAQSWEWTADKGARWVRFLTMASAGRLPDWSSQETTLNTVGMDSRWILLTSLGIIRTPHTVTAMISAKPWGNILCSLVGS